MLIGQRHDSPTDPSQFLDDTCSGNLERLVLRVDAFPFEIEPGH